MKVIARHGEKQPFWRITYPECDAGFSHCRNSAMTSMWSRVWL